MDKMQPMQSPLGGNDDDQNKTDPNETNIVRNIQREASGPTDLTQDTGDDNGLRKLTSHMSNRRLDRRLPDDRFDTHLGEERDDLDNKAEDLKVPRRRKSKIGEDSILDDLKIFVPPVIRDYNTLMSFMHNHVVELRFTRRHNKMGYKDTRRMVCTTNWKFLSSVFTRRIFNWNTPKSRRGVSWYKQRNLIIVWDLMVENFRIIPVTDIRFVSAYKCTSLIEKGRFILFYRRNIRTLTPTQEKKYFNA